MPVKSKRFPSNGIYEGKITGLDEEEKKALESAGVGGNVDGKDISPANVTIGNKLHINSSSDIVTKDGSKVGGGLPITNVTDLEADNPHVPEEGGYMINYVDDTHSDEEGTKCLSIICSNNTISDAYGIEVSPEKISFISADGETDKEIGFIRRNLAIENYSIGSDNYMDICKGYFIDKPTIIININNKQYNFDFANINDKGDVTITIPSGTGTLAIKEDIPTYYRHFITLKSSDSKYILFFNAYTKDSTQIGSLTDLFGKLGNSDYMCNGKADTLIPYTIHIGTSANDTTITGDGTISISSFTEITDKVSAV